MVPGDTFRAAAAEQLQAWADRTGAIMSKEVRQTRNLERFLTKRWMKLSLWVISMLF